MHNLEIVYLVENAYNSREVYTQENKPNDYIILSTLAIYKFIGIDIKSISNRWKIH